jgi:glycosyltransferase involved in cell wall biosynthesis
MSVPRRTMVSSMLPTPSELVVAVDARELIGRPTGVGRYLAHLLERWVSLPEARPCRFILYAPERIPGLPAPGPGAFLEERVVAGTRGTRWEQTRFPAAARRDRPDVLFAPGYSAPLLVRIPVVLTIHDLSFYAHPEWFPPRERLRRRWTTRLAARRARLVLTDSEFSKREIARYLNVPDSRLRAIPLGIPRVALPPGPASARQPIVLFVGSLFNRRRVPDLVQAFARVVRACPDARLEVVGDDRTYPRQDLRAVARETGVADRVTIRSYVPDATLVELYATARVFVFLSEYEGFGLTPLEALSRGVPLVVLDTPIAREVYGHAARYVGPGEIDRTAGAIIELLADESARAAQLAHAETVLARYSWDAAARATLAALVDAAGREQRHGQRT